LLVQLLSGERSQTYVPDESQPPQSAPGLVEVICSEGREVGGGGDCGRVPVVWFSGLSGQPGFEFGKVINEVISDPPDCLVRGVDPWWLVFDEDLDRAAIPPWPACRYLEHMVHHCGHDVGGMPVIDLRSQISHENILLRRADIRDAWCWRTPP